MMSSASALFASEASHQENQAPDLKLVFRLINFAIFAGVLGFVLKKPVADYFSKRSELLKEKIEANRASHQKALEEHQEIARKLKNIEQESRELLTSFHQDGIREKEKIIEQANSLVSQLREDAKKITESELKKAKEELKNIAIGLAVELAEKSVQRDITAEDEMNLAHNFVKGIDKVYD